MKSLEELYKEVAGSGELKEVLKSMSEKVIGEFLKKHDCGATVKEFLSFLESKKDGVLGGIDVASIAGGLLGGSKTSEENPLKNLKLF